MRKLLHVRTSMPPIPGGHAASGLQVLLWPYMLFSLAIFLWGGAKREGYWAPSEVLGSVSSMVIAVLGTIIGLMLLLHVTGAVGIPMWLLAFLATCYVLGLFITLYLLY